MLYVRGDKENYDSWERDGCTGWGFKDVLPYFKKSENCQVPDTDPQFRGKDGEFTISCPPNNEYTDHWIKAGVEAGLPYNKDYNGEKMEGISVAQVQIALDLPDPCSIQRSEPIDGPLTFPSSFSSR